MLGAFIFGCIVGALSVIAFCALAMNEDDEP